MYSLTFAIVGLSDTSADTEADTRALASRNAASFFDNFGPSETTVVFLPGTAGTAGFPVIKAVSIRRGERIIHFALSSPIKKDISTIDMSFPCKRFSVELPTNGGCSWLLCGASRSGKTTFMKYIYNEYYKKFITVMFSMNKHADIYKDLDKKVIVSDKFLSTLLAEAREINSLCDNKFPFLFISDDYVDSKIKNDPEITRLLTIARNHLTSSIMSFQGRTLVSAVGRNQVNFICIFRQNTPKEWKNVIEEFLDMWLPMDMTMPEKIAFCVEATKDHQLFFVDNIKCECYITKLTKSQL